MQALGRSINSDNANGNYSKRGLDVLKSELTAKFIEKAREHFRAKATETQQLQQLKEETARSSTQVAAEYTATDRACDCRVLPRRRSSGKFIAAATEHCHFEYSGKHVGAEPTATEHWDTRRPNHQHLC